MEPTIPERAHTSTHIPQSLDLEEARDLRGKRPVVTMKDVKLEWHTGSKRRVIKYYVVWTAVGLVIGAIIGVVIGVCVRFVGK